MRSLSARLTFTFFLIGAAILGAFGASLYFWVREGGERALARDLVTGTQLFHERFLAEHDEVSRGVHGSLAAELEDFLEASGGRASVRRPDGSPVFVSKRFDPDVPRFRARSDRLTAPSGETFDVRFAVSEAPLHEMLAQLRLCLAISCPLVLALQGLLGTLFVRRLLSPLEQIRSHAVRISRANLSERVPEPALTGELRDLARTFNEMLERLDLAFQDLHNFAADAAHELRTPLANLRLEIETAAQGNLAPGEYEKIFASVAEEVDRMNRVVADLFTLAKMDLRQLALEKERVSLRLLLDEARETWQPSAGERGIEIRVEGKDVEVSANPGALRRVLMNLTENALKYNVRGGRVTLSVERENGTAKVRVRDTGIGMAAEHLPKLFHRFYRVDSGRSRQTGGAGLGLAVCKSFIEAHEGTISVESEAGIGTTFTVALPALDSPAPDDASRNR